MKKAKKVSRKTGNSSHAAGSRIGGRAGGFDTSEGAPGVASPGGADLIFRLSCWAHPSKSNSLLSVQSIYRNID